MVTLRAAQAGDNRAIRALIHRVQINPMGLDWRHFLLAVDEAGRLVGCGQIKLHRDGSRELASIAVIPEYRGRGVARAIIERLLSENELPLYLTCNCRLASLYRKFGFETLSPEDMPLYFRRVWWVWRAVRQLLPGRPCLAVMRKA